MLEKRKHNGLLTYLLRMRLPAKPSIGPANPGIDLGKPVRAGEVLVFDYYEQIHTVDRDANYEFCYYSTDTETFPDCCSHHHLLDAPAVVRYSMHEAT